DPSTAYRRRSASRCRSSTRFSKCSTGVRAPAKPFRLSCAGRLLSNWRNAGLLETDLPPGLVERDRRGVGQIEASITGTQGYAQPRLLRQCVENGGRQAACLRPEQEGIAVDETGCVQRPGSLRREREYPVGVHR